MQLLPNKKPAEAGFGLMILDGPEPRGRLAGKPELCAIECGAMAGIGNSGDDDRGGLDRVASPGLVSAQDRFLALLSPCSVLEAGMSGFRRSRRLRTKKPA